jgi:hypothetical protein
MPTLAITQAVGQLIRALQNNGIIIYTRYYRGFYLHINKDLRSVSYQIQITDEVIMTLKRAKLIEKKPNAHYNWPAKYVLELTEAGRDFRLPPEQFWIRE